MKRLSLVLLPALILAALLPFGSIVAAARTGNAQVLATATGSDGADCDHDGGHSPGDDVCTPTPTVTVTPTLTPTATPTTVACPPAEHADFNKVPVGSSVQGMGVVAPNVNITALYSAVHLRAGAQPKVYAAAPNNTIINGGIDTLTDGFGDVQAHLKREAPRFTFTFQPGLTVTDFSLHMVDFGDWNPTDATQHVVVMRAFNASNALVAHQVLSYTTPPRTAPLTSSLYGNLQVNGDALTAPAGMPGNWTWHVSGVGITRVVLIVGAGQDPNFALDGLYVKFSCP